MVKTLLAGGRLPPIVVTEAARALTGAHRIGAHRAAWMRLGDCCPLDWARKVRIARVRAVVVPDALLHRACLRAGYRSIAAFWRADKSLCPVVEALLQLTPKTNRALRRALLADHGCR